MKHKNNILSIFLTTLVIGLLILSGPARAIDVNLETPDIDYINDDTVEFKIAVDINDGEFLPLAYTDLMLNYGDDSKICKINNDNTIDNCDFLTVTSAIKDLQGSYGYGYGYGYGYSNGNYGYGYDSGYGYGYGYSGVSGHGTITYTLTVDVSKLPVEFLDSNIKVEARVYSGTEDNWRYFKGTSSFFVDSSYEPASVPREGGISKANTMTMGNVMIQYGIGAIPAGVSKITVKQVAPKANPSNSNFKIMGKVYDFTTDGLNNFDGDLTITFTYTDEELGDHDESRINPAFYNEATGEWELLTVVSRDITNNKLTFLTNHFTQFALLADISAVSGGDNVPSGGGDSSSRRRASSLDLIFPEDNNVPSDESNLPGSDISGGLNQDSGLGGITGAVTGNIGKGGSVVALIVLAVGAAAFILIRRKKGKK
jgi:hypothetical protein